MNTGIIIILNDSISLRPDHVQKQQLGGGIGDVTLLPRMAELVAEARGPCLHRAH